MSKSGGTKRPVAASSSSEPIAFQVLGTPAPKGSATAFVVKNKTTGKHRAVVVQGGAKGSAGRERLRSWDGAVREAAARAVGSGRTSPPFVAVGLRVDIEFRIARPANHYGTGKNAGKLKPGAPPFPFGKPDRDKLERTTLDAMSGIVFDDDARVVAGETRKVWANPGNEGAAVHVRAMRPDEADSIGALPHPRPELAGAVVLRLVPPPASAPGKASPGDVGGAAGPDREAAKKRIRGLVDGSLFAAESHAMKRHGRAPLSSVHPRQEHGGDGPCAACACDGDHAPPACLDPQCWRRTPTDGSLAFPEDASDGDGIDPSGVGFLDASDLAEADDFGGPDL